MDNTVLRGDAGCFMDNLSSELIGINDVAKYLGVQVSTVYGWVHIRAIPYFKIGRLLRFKKAEIDQWINERKVQEQAI